MGTCPWLQSFVIGVCDPFICLSMLSANMCLAADVSLCDCASMSTDLSSQAALVKAIQNCPSTLRNSSLAHVSAYACTHACILYQEPIPMRDWHLRMGASGEPFVTFCWNKRCRAGGMFSFGSQHFCLVGMQRSCMLPYNSN